jgi:hypothetical protein
MASNDPPNPGRLTGDEIVSEILRNAGEGQFRVRKTALLPCIYHVYLHPEDHRQLRPVLGYLQSESCRALEEKLQDLNTSASPSLLSRALGVGQAEPIEYKKLEEDWLVEFLPDPDDRLEKGEIEIYSELGTEPRGEFGAGAMTVLISKRSADGQLSQRLSPAGAGKPSRKIYARLRFEDKSGPQTFAVTKDQVVIGRGGKSFWVDLKLEAPADVSREHCRLRRDPDKNRFFIKDVSQFGTTVNGERLPSSVEISESGEKHDRNVEVPLPERARIGLADVLYLDFETEAI